MRFPSLIQVKGQGHPLEEVGVAGAPKSRQCSYISTPSSPWWLADDDGVNRADGDG
jgi:hypothetical protein